MINLQRRSVYLLTLLALSAGLGFGVRSPVSAAAGCNTFNFKTAPAYPAGSNPRTLAVGDFNHDGLQDLVVEVAISQHGGIAILSGVGSGKFAPPKMIDAGPSPNFACVADFNGDGNADLAVTSFTETVSITLGRGDGSFAPALNYQVGFNAGFALAADLNQDGKLDLALTNAFTPTISIMLGNGQGGFGPSTTYSLGGDEFARKLAVADFNSDGKLDLLVLLSTPLIKNMVLFFGDGRGGFGVPMALAAGFFPIDLLVDDFNGDGHADFLVSDTVDTFTFDGEVLTFLGDGTGNFSEPISYRAPVGTLALADFNGDGKKDVAGFDRLLEVAAVLFSDGTGSFTRQTVFQAAGLPFDIAVGDFNHDNKPDLAFAGFSTDDVSIVLNEGAGKFSAADAYVLGLDTLPNAVGLGDFNHDGHTDVAVSQSDIKGGEGAVALMFGSGTGELSAPTSVGSGGAFPTALAVADFNNDGHDDLAVSNSSSNIVVRLGLGDGHFGAATVAANIDAVFMIATDFNKDGKPDLVLVNRAPYSATVMLGTGSGGFNTPVNFSVGSTPTAVAAGDLNNDGQPDLIVTNHDSNNISLLLGDGAGGVASTVNIATAQHPNFVAVGDFNGDGKADLALSHEDPGKLSILLGTGAGSFTLAGTYETDGLPNSVTARDLNGDGKLDLLVTNEWLYTVTSLRGDGAGGFTPAHTFGAGGQPRALAVGELNEDGQPDIIVANPGAGTLVVALSAPCPAGFSSVSFSAAGYSFNEGTRNATLTVVRSGDVTTAATVNYATMDDPAVVRCDARGQTASARCDYATTVERLQFAPGEMSKTISIPLIDDAHVEDAETFQVALSNPSPNIALSMPSTATITIIDDDTVNTPNPIFTTAFFVRQHYLDFLSREPEPGEPWSSILQNCSDLNNNPACDRLTVSAAFFGSPEFRLKGFYVFRFYRAALGRLPTYAEISLDMRAVTGQTAAEVFAKKASYADAFTQHPVFVTRYGALTNAQYVQTLMASYGLMSITAPDPNAPDGSQKVTLTSSDLTARLNGGALTRGQVLRAIADSDQVFAAEFNQAFVAMEYYGYLRRTPDTAGYQAWLNYLNAHPSDLRTVVNGFVNSQEYRLRFGPQ